MDTINIDLRIDQVINTDISIDLVIDAINEQRMTLRWNHVGCILNQVELDIRNLTDEQKEIIKVYLTKKLALFDDKKISLNK